MGRAYKLHLNKVKNKAFRTAIIEDVTQFHHHVEIENNIKVARLMIVKWTDLYKKCDEIEFINYFQRQWLSPKRMGWFDHYCDLVPIKNNGLESTNRYVKEKKMR